MTFVREEKMQKGRLEVARMSKQAVFKLKRPLKALRIIIK